MEKVVVEQGSCKGGTVVEQEKQTKRPIARGEAGYLVFLASNDLLKKISDPDRVVHLIHSI